MVEPFTGEIRIFAGNFAPRGWSYCDGQLLAVSQNDALFSLLGTVYGGDGRTTFGLPDLRGRIPIHEGQGPGLSNRRLGAKSGEENVTLTTNTMPNHTHTLSAVTTTATQKIPSSSRTFGGASGHDPYVDVNTAALVDMNGADVASTGGQSHNNLMPYQCLHFIIALFGVYPSRN